MVKNMAEGIGGETLMEISNAVKGRTALRRVKGSGWVITASQCKAANLRTKKDSAGDS